MKATEYQQLVYLLSVTTTKLFRRASLRKGPQYLSEVKNFVIRKCCFANQGWLGTASSSSFLIPVSGTMLRCSALKTNYRARFDKGSQRIHHLCLGVIAAAMIPSGQILMCSYFNYYAIGFKKQPQEKTLANWKNRVIETLVKVWKKS